MLSKIKIFDGAFGTMLQKYGLKGGDVPEELNITNPEVIRRIHREYVSSGADFISTNTFGANRYKLKNSKYSLKEILLSAVKNARLEAKESKVMLDVGPLGILLAPLGTLNFDDAYDAFREIVLLTKDLVDGYILETFTDLFELKSAVLAVKENSDKFLIASMSFDESGRTLTGTTPEIMTNVLEGLGVDVLGVNCSLGPKELLPIVEKILSVTHTPVIVQANRGLPSIKNKETHYDLSIEDFMAVYEIYSNIGVSILGGCCGTDPEFISRISKFKNKPVKELNNPFFTEVMSRSQIVRLDEVRVCGERLNPTGKKKLKEALLNGDYEYLLGEGIKQVNAKADLLDLNVGVPKIDEPKVMKEAILKLSEIINLPFQIDSSNKEAIEMGVRYCNGLPIINSVNGEIEVMDRVFPIAKKYGCVVLGLTLDNNGVPKTAEERFNIAKRIVDYAWDKYKIRKEKIIIDTLTLTASAEQALVKETLDALEMVTKRLNVKTALGVSNVSFGLPNRGLLNKTFLTLAMQKGLTMPIINPCDIEMMNSIYSYKVLYNYDVNALKYIENTSDVEVVKTSLNMGLDDYIILGMKDEVLSKTNELLENKEPLDIINNILIPTLTKVGESFEKQKIFLPQLIMSAEACKVAFNAILAKFPRRLNYTRPIIMCTVKGDVHDIGKNIICVILESYGYSVLDLGKDVDVSKIIEAFKRENPIAIGLSALMTTTVINMEETIKELTRIPNMCPIFVGGAVLNEEIANEIGADFYSKDALEFVEILKKENING